MMLISGVMLFALATTLVVTFRYLEHVKKYRGAIWSLLRIASAVCYLASAIFIGNLVGMPIGELKLVFNTDDSFDIHSFSVSGFYLIMAVVSLLSAFIIEKVFFNEYLLKSPVEE